MTLTTAAGVTAEGWIVLIIACGILVAICVLAAVDADRLMDEYRGRQVVKAAEQINRESANNGSER